MVYLAKASNVYCTGTLRLVILMICNTFSTLYREVWQTMKRQWRQGKVSPKARTELTELKKEIESNLAMKLCDMKLRQEYKCICYGFGLYSEILRLTNFKEYFSVYFKTIFPLIVLLFFCLHQKLSHTF